MHEQEDNGGLAVGRSPSAHVWDAGSAHGAIFRAISLVDRPAVSPRTAVTRPGGKTHDSGVSDMASSIIGTFNLLDRLRADGRLGADHTVGAYDGHS